MFIFVILLVAGIINPVFAQSPSSSLQASVLPLLGGADGINFDDLVFAPDIHKVLVPAGHTRKLYLIDPDTYEAVLVSGFNPIPENKKSHNAGITSADEGEGFLFVADHDTQKLDMIDVKTGTIMATAPFSGGPDYVRYVGINHEVWVTQPSNNQIEVFTFTVGNKPTISSKTVIPVTDGPESLVVDHIRRRAYSNLGQETAAIDLYTHAVVSHWPNGCERPRGLAIDEPRGFLFVGCSEGKTVVFDLNKDNTQLSSLTTGPGVDMVSYNATLSHLYLTGSKDASLSVLGVSAQGQLSLLGVDRAVARAHCVVGDDRNNIWVCDPQHGQLLRYKDTFPAVR